MLHVGSDVFTIIKAGTSPSPMEVHTPSHSISDENDGPWDSTKGDHQHSDADEEDGEPDDEDEDVHTELSLKWFIFWYCYLLSSHFASTGTPKIKYALMGKYTWKGLLAWFYLLSTKDVCFF